jgi:hypothetical protein
MISAVRSCTREYMYVRVQGSTSDGASRNDPERTPGTLELNA